MGVVCSRWVAAKAGRQAEATLNLSIWGWLPTVFAPHPARLLSSPIDEHIHKPTPNQFI